MIKRAIKLVFLLSILPLVIMTAPLRAETIKPGLLKFGTVGWLMDVIEHHGLDRKAGYKLSPLELASNNATKVALLGGEADVIVSDWFWVLRQRASGSPLVFTPYSMTVGALMVPAASKLKSIAELGGRKIAVAGGPLDKSWLLLRAVALKAGAGDLAESATPVFGAPPLLNQQALWGEVDATLNYWHFAAALEAAGFRRLVSVSELMTSAGLKGPIPLIGFVFSEKLVKEKPNALAGFLKSVAEAQDMLLKSDAEWDRLRPLMRAADDARFRALRDRYREGIRFAWGQEQRRDAEKLFGILARLGGEQLTGKGVRFDARIFWRAPEK